MKFTLVKQYVNQGTTANLKKSLDPLSYDQIQNKSDLFHLDYPRLQSITSKPIPQGKTRAQMLNTKDFSPLLSRLSEAISMDQENEDEYLKKTVKYLVPHANPKSLFRKPAVVPSKVVSARLKMMNESKYSKVTAIFHFDSTCVLEGESHFLKFKIDNWQHLSPNVEYSIMDHRRVIGYFQLKDEVEKLNQTYYNPEISMTSPNDISFLTLVVSIPSLSPKEAHNLFIISYQNGTLVAFIKSKIAEILCSKIDFFGTWPESLGRFLFVLNPDKARASYKKLKQKNFEEFFRGFLPSDESIDVLLHLIFYYLSEFYKDAEKFFLRLILSSYLRNVAFDHADPKPDFDFLHRTFHSNPFSNFHQLLSDVVLQLQDIRTERKLKGTSLSDTQFISSILETHQREFDAVLSHNPYPHEASSPHFFPLKLSLKEALEQYQIRVPQIDDSISTPQKPALLDHISSSRESKKSVREQMKESQGSSYLNEYESSVSDTFKEQEYDFEKPIQQQRKSSRSPKKETKPVLSPLSSDTTSFLDVSPPESSSKYESESFSTSGPPSGAGKKPHKRRKAKKDPYSSVDKTPAPLPVISPNLSSSDSEDNFGSKNAPQTKFQQGEPPQHIMQKGTPLSHLSSSMISSSSSVSGKQHFSNEPLSGVLNSPSLSQPLSSNIPETPSTQQFDDHAPTLTETGSDASSLNTRDFRKPSNAADDQNEDDSSGALNSSDEDDF